MMKRTIRFAVERHAETGSVLACNLLQTDLLILDEPVDGLDPVMQRQIWKYLNGGSGRAENDSFSLPPIT